MSKKLESVAVRKEEPMTLICARPPRPGSDGVRNIRKKYVRRCRQVVHDQQAGSRWGKEAPNEEDNSTLGKSNLLD